MAASLWTTWGGGPQMPGSLFDVSTLHVQQGKQIDQDSVRLCAPLMP